MITLDLSILNQKGTPMFYSDIFANRPTFGIVGRIFISTDTAAIYRDTGTAWDLISDATGSGTNIYNSDGTLTGNRTVSSGNFSLTFNPATTFDTTLTAANNASSLSIFGVNRLSYAAGFSANNIGALYGGTASFGLQTFAGSATFANSNIASGGASINSIDFSSAGSTITMTQSSGIRVMSGSQSQLQYQGTNSGTITHAAISQNLGFYRPSGASGTLTITNAYSHLINALDDYGAGFTFTNRWGIYQAGASDTNYFAANTLIGGSVSTGHKLEVFGRIAFNTSGQTYTISSYRGANSAGFNIFIGGGGESSVGQVGNTILGSRNVSFGETAFFSNTEGWGNSAIGRDSLYSNTTGINNSVFGYAGLVNNTTGSYNSAFGARAGQYTNSGGFNITSDYGVYLGFQARGTDASTNEITIGYNANGGGSNTATLGNTSILRTYLNGNVLIGTTTDAGYKLDVNGVQRISSSATSTAILQLYNNDINDGNGLYIKAGGINNQKYIATLLDASNNLRFQFYANGNMGINVNDPTSKFHLNGSFRIDNQTSGTAGGSSGQHLIINCDGTQYKIALLNN